MAGRAEGLRPPLPELAGEDVLRVESSTTPQAGVIRVLTPELRGGGPLWIRPVEHAGIVVIRVHRGQAMKPELLPPSRSGCDRAALPVPKVTRSRRGERVLPFDGSVWQCPSGRADPADGASPYPFSTLELMPGRERATAPAWREWLDQRREDRPRGELRHQLPETTRRRAG